MTDVQRLALIRHGETEANDAQLAYGRLESPLNPRGIEQVRSTAEALNAQATAFHHIVSSPLGRARETASIIADALDLEITIEDDIFVIFAEILKRFMVRDRVRFHNFSHDF